MPVNPREELLIEPRNEGVVAARFTAMASPCELLLTSSDKTEAFALGRLVAKEAWRIERKYSRYRNDSIVSWIHHNRDKQLILDDETASLLDFARQCYEASGGLFDITSGILRRVWKFDGSDHLPTAGAVKELLPFIGFHKLDWRAPCLKLPFGMELDFGGIGKEYAVDKAFELLCAQCSAPFLINFGGDLRTNRAPIGLPWKVGIEHPDTTGETNLILDLERGALATSGDSRRYLIKNGTRYGHVLNPKSGWPVPDAPRSVTVAASSCTEAGQLATLALLHGAHAEQFLEQQAVRYWLIK